jgi:serine/threonine protein kinase
MQQNESLECRLAQLTVEDVDAAGVMLQEEMLLKVMNSDSWLTPQSYELAKQTALFSTPCTVGQYELQGMIAPGGMGEVYKATHSRLKREVAVKVIRRNQQDSPLFYENFLKEIETVGQLEHPNMVRAYDALEYEGYLFLVMELLAGDSLHSLVSKGRHLTVHELLQVMTGICEAILHLHANGYLHLDIKPANVMLLDNGTTKLIDYGLAVRRDAIRSGGVLYGTVGYMPPEQLSAGFVDERTDIFAVGKVLQFLLMKGVDSDPTQHDHVVLGELQRLAEKMIDDDPGNRPEHATDVLVSLLDLKKKLHAESGKWLPGDSASSSEQERKSLSSASFWSRYLFVFLLALVVAFLLWRGVGLKSGSEGTRFSGDLTNSIGMHLNVVPGGTFRNNTTYSINGDLFQVDDANSVSFSPFYIGVCEVTQKEYRQVTGDEPSEFEGDDNPVESLTFDEAQEFCRRLSELPAEKQAGRVYRIPTNLEWEYACRAGTLTKFSFGDEEWKIDSHAWYNGNAGSPHEVGLKRANAWGIYDMHGNVFEFCTLDKNSRALLSEKAKSIVKCGLRGGSWAANSMKCGAGFCALTNGKWHGASIGMRVVCNLMPEVMPEIERTDESETTLYTIELDLRGDPDPKPMRTVNAVVYREENSTHYWAPAEVNQWAEIEYRLDLPAPIDSTVDFRTLVWVYNEHYFPVFDSLAQGTLEISCDGKKWHVLFHSESSLPLVDNRTSVLPLLKGAKVVYLRAKLFSSRFGKQNRFSQFLRRDNTRKPHQLQFLLRTDGQDNQPRVPTEKLAPSNAAEQTEVSEAAAD